ncbi:MAG: hypothetical protein ACLQUZ_11165 [Rhizomicrobium sp.]
MKMIVRAVFAASLMCTAAGTAILSTPAAHAEEKIGPKVGKPLNDAIKAAQAGDFPAALAAIKEAQGVEDRTPFEDYKINAILAYVALKMNDIPTATTAYEACADSPAMPDEDKKQTFYNAILLSAQAKHYQKAIVYGQQLQALNGLDYKIESMLAIAYYSTRDFSHAQQFAQMSVDAAKAAGQRPPEQALEIIMSSQAQQKNEAGAEQTLETLALDFNKPETWSQLIDIALSSIGGASRTHTSAGKDPDALYLLRLKMVVPNAMSNGSDYLILADAANQQGYPTEAYNVLQKGIGSGKITAAQAGPDYAQARSGAALDQRSLAAIARQAERAKTGEQDIKLAEDYWGYGRYADAEVAARRAIGKGGLKDTSEGPLLLGMLLDVQGKYDDAIQTLAQVDGSTTRTRTAHLWSLYAQAQKIQAQGSAAAASAPAPAQH